MTKMVEKKKKKEKEKKKKKNPMTHNQPTNQNYL